MASWHIRRTRAVLAAGAGLTALLTTAFPASADADDNTLYSKDDQWGTVMKTDDCVQADSWVVRVSGVGGTINAAMFESQYPASARAPKQHAGGDQLVDLAPGGIGLGKVSALYSRALGHAHPNSRAGGNEVPARGEIYADAGGGAVDVGVPYIANPAGGTQLSPIGVHVDGIQVSAWSRPGKPVAFTGGAASGYISVAGFDLIDIPDLWASNLGARIPSDYSQDPLVLALTNEQVTTDQQGKATLGKDGKYKYDGTATSGFVNGIHASVLGSNVADVSVAHAAVIRDPKRTDKYAVKDNLNPVNPGDTIRAAAPHAAFPGKGGAHGWAPFQKPGAARSEDGRSMVCAPFAPPAEAAGTMRSKARTSGMNCW
ncbi:hypothetical protein ACIBUY_03265 [Streptomyces sp. NPDC050085]|uniref:hypothetical protein n=1 Tax=Streptomyces sp. NPDC050085 TaxID=3365600 RepID=UPI0037A2E2FB